jgi:hypothetical protein
MVSVRSHRAAVGHVAASFVVIAVIVVGGVAFVSSMNKPSGGPAVGSASETTFYSGASPQGLQLQIKLKASGVAQGGALQAHILLVNTFSQNVLLHPDFAANPNIDKWNWDDYLCGMSPVEHVFGFELLQGHYTAANLSQTGAPLTLMPPVAISCPNFAYGESYIQNAEFAPNSDVATFSANASGSADFKPQTIRMQMNATTGYCTESPYKYTETQTVGGTTTVTSGTEYSLNCGSNGVDSLTGYWSPYGSCTYPAGKGVNGTAQGLYGSCFHRFAPGTYTVVAEHLWNQTVFGYFDVVGENQGCVSATKLQGLPNPTERWFTVGVDYPGPWEATAVVYDHGSPVPITCYVGTGQGYFEYQSLALSNNATIVVTASKLDDGTGILFVGVNGKTNSTTLPYGTVTVMAPADYSNISP